MAPHVTWQLLGGKWIGSPKITQQGSRVASRCGYSRPTTLDMAGLQGKRGGVVPRSNCWSPRTLATATCQVIGSHLETELRGNAFLWQRSLISREEPNKALERRTSRWEINWLLSFHLDDWSTASSPLLSLFLSSLCTEPLLLQHFFFLIFKVQGFLILIRNPEYTALCKLTRYIGHRLPNFLHFLSMRDLVNSLGRKGRKLTHWVPSCPLITHHALF